MGSLILMIDLLMGLLLIGAVSNNIEHNGMWIDVRIIIAAYIIMAIYLSRTRVIVYSKSIKIERIYFVRSITIFVIIISSYQYMVEGIPLLSADPDVARMEFMTSSIAYKVLANFMPFIITFLFSYLCLTWKSSSKLDIMLFSICILLYILNGHKASIIIVALHCLLGWVAVGNNIKIGKIIFLALIGLPIISFVFFHVAGLDNFFDGFTLFFERLTGIAEFGLYAAVNDLSNELSASDVFINVKYLYLKIIGNYEGYSPSFGRLITATYYGTSIQDSLWELTPTMFADFYTLGGWVGVVVGTLLYSLLMKYVATLAEKSKSIYSRCFLIVVFFQLFLNIMLGSLASRFLVNMAPLVFFWLCGLSLKIFLSTLFMRPSAKKFGKIIFNV